MKELRLQRPWLSVAHSIGELMRTQKRHDPLDIEEISIQFEY